MSLGIGLALDFIFDWMLSHALTLPGQFDTDAHYEI